MKSLVGTDCSVLISTVICPARITPASSRRTPPLPRPRRTATSPSPRPRRSGSPTRPGCSLLLLGVLLGLGDLPLRLRPLLLLIAGRLRVLLALEQHGLRLLLLAVALGVRLGAAQKYAKEQEAEGIAAVGKAEAEAIRARALAEAEGIDKKAEAMKKYGEAGPG